MRARNRSRPPVTSCRVALNSQASGKKRASGHDRHRRRGQVLPPGEKVLDRIGATLVRFLRGARYRVCSLRAAVALFPIRRGSA